MIKVTNNANTIDISDVNDTNIASIDKKLISSVGMYFQNNCTFGLGQSRFGYGKRTPGRTTKTIINIVLSNSSVFSFDCDEVQNQPTWQGCTNANLITAQQDIQSWL